MIDYHIYSSPRVSLMSVAIIQIISIWLTRQQKRKIQNSKSVLRYKKYKFWELKKECWKQIKNVYYSISSSLWMAPATAMSV